MTRLADLEINLDAGTVHRDGDRLPVSDRSFALLRELCLAGPETVSHRDLLDRVWPDRVVSPDTLTQRVRLLRQDLGDPPGEEEYIVSVHGRGYRLGYHHPARQSGPGPGRVRWRWAAVILLALAVTVMIMNLLREPETPAPPAPTESASEQPAEAPPPSPDTD